MRPTRGPALALPPFVAMPLLVIALAACSSPGETKLPTFTGASGATSSATTLATQSAPATSSAAPSTSSGAPPRVVSVTRDPLPASVPAAARPVTEAWFAYWAYLAQALSDPAAPGAVEGLGSVATGSAASDAIRQIGDLRAKKWHTAGQLTIAVVTASVTGTTGAVCSTIRDISFSADATDTPQEAVVPRAPAFRVTLLLSGPTWRVQTLTRVAGC